MSVEVIVFDGSDCIGGNKVYLSADGTGLFFDFGLNYSTVQTILPKAGQTVSLKR